MARRASSATSLRPSSCRCVRLVAAARLQLRPHAFASHLLTFAAIVFRIFQFLQIALRNYDPQKDKRFNGTFRLPFTPRPQLKACVLGSEEHCGQAKALGVDSLVRTAAACIFIP